MFAPRSQNEKPRNNFALKKIQNVEHLFKTAQEHKVKNIKFLHYLIVELLNNSLWQNVGIDKQRADVIKHFTIVNYNHKNYCSSFNSSVKGITVLES